MSIKIIPVSRYNYTSAQLVLLQLTGYTLLFWCFAPGFRYSFGPDFVSYHSIAKNYLQGNVHGAVNAWWSPAYSWLLAVVSAFCPDALTANKILQFCAGLLAMKLIRRLIYFHTPVKKDLYAECLCLAFTPVLALWALRSDTPDFLSAIALLWFFLLVLKLLQSCSKRTAMSAGLAGALAYLFKSYNFYFITAFGLIVLIVELIRGKKINVLRQWLVVALSFLAVSFLWMLIMATKYNKLVISSIASHTPCTNQYVLSIKPNAAACDCAPLQFDSTNRVSNWETPEVYGRASLNDLLNKQDNAGVFLSNAKHFFSSFVSPYQLMLLAVLVIATSGFWRKNGYLYFLFWAIYCSGYFLLHLEPRFFMMPSLLLMIVIGISFLRLSETVTSGRVNIPLLLVIIALFTQSHLRNIVKGDADAVPAEVYRFARENERDLNGKNIASAAGLYDDGVYLSFFTGSRFYGSLNAPLADTVSRVQMQRQQVNWFLYKNDAGTYSVLRVDLVR